MSSQASPEELKLVASYLSERKAMIVDPCSGARSSYAKTLKDLGIKTSKMSLFSQYDEAMKEVVALRPNVIVCDYHLGDQCGLSLVQRHRELVQEPNERTFILVTGNSRESTIAEAAEEDVDGYVLKPFTLNVLSEHFFKTILAKVNPSPYRKALDAGRASLQAGEIEPAIEHFTKATMLFEKPCMAHYYLGQADVQKKDLPAAENSFTAGLKYNEFHYRCLSGQLDLYLGQQRMEDAYQVGRKIAFVFPLSPQRLDQVLRMCVRTRTFDEIEQYYDLYTGIEYRTPELTKCMAAALLVGGRYHMQRKNVGVARSLFEKGLVVSGKSLPLLKEMITSFCALKEYEHASQFLKFIPPDQTNAPLAQALELVVYEGEANDSQVIDKGRKMLEKGAHDPLVYEILIKRSVKAGLRNAAEGYMYDAAKRWPESREKFAKMLEGEAPPA